MNDWWRSWHGAPSDPKWITVARKANVAPGVVVAVAWWLLDHASQQDERGSVVTFDAETCADFTGFPHQEVIAVLDAMGAKSIIVGGKLAKWEKRQPRREDGSAARVKEHRERKRAEAEPTLPLDSTPAAEKVSAPVDVSPTPVADSTCMREDVPRASAPEMSSGPEVLISPAAFELADKVTIEAGHDLKFVPPSWCGAAARVQVWLDNGWRPQLILENVRAQMHRRGATGPPVRSVRFFEPGLAEAHARAAAPLPVAVISEPEVIHAKSRTGGGLGRLARELLGGDDDAGHHDAGRAPGAGPLRVIDGSRHS